ncbi:hypothetical protein [Agrococcus sp. Marseille-P2731]|uniref:hypothetical protein n=1 Tax=Agrococcus sp. Marseille-P2731 TaxID=1841862 RepID=UPI001F402306|nr:hypothetical protein [Agrococcus sp. Marseille-P2731]
MGLTGAQEPELEPEPDELDAPELEAAGFDAAGFDSLDFEEAGFESLDDDPGPFPAAARESVR